MWGLRARAAAAAAARRALPRATGQLRCGCSCDCCLICSRRWAVWDGLVPDVTLHLLYLLVLNVHLRPSSWVEILCSV